MRTQKKFKIGILKPEKEKIEFGSSFIKDYSASIANFCSVLDIFKARNIDYEETSEKHSFSYLDILISPGYDKMSVNLKKKIKTFVKNGGFLIAFGNQDFKDKKMREFFNLEVIDSEKLLIPDPKEFFISKEYLSIPREYNLKIQDKTNSFIINALNKKEIIGKTKENDYILLRRYGKGKILYIYDLGFSLFLRYATCTHIKVRENITNKGLDDLGPLFFILFKKIISDSNKILVYSCISPKIMSFSIDHDTESKDCIQSGKRIISLNNKYNIKPTWYLRTNLKYGEYDGSPYLYTKPFILNPVDYSINYAKDNLKNQIFGYHSEQYFWIKKNKNNNLDIAKAYSSCINLIRKETGQKIRSGSMHFGNYVEKFPEDYEALGKAGINLFRQAYKDNVITEFRPYSVFTNDLKELNIRLYLQNFKDDFSSFNPDKEENKLIMKKTLFWIYLLGEGNLFLHSHPHNFDDVEGAIKNYEKIYKILTKIFYNINNEEMIDYYEEKKEQIIDYSYKKGRLKINLSKNPSKLILIIESNKLPKNIKIFFKGKELIYYLKKTKNKAIISFHPIEDKEKPSDIKIKYRKLKLRKIKVKIRNIIYKFKQIPGKIKSIFSSNNQNI